MTQMAAVRMHSFGGPEVLQVDLVERPAPGAGEVLVKVLAASVNPVDWKIRNGSYPAVKDEDLPIVPGRDICGTVEGIGGASGQFKPGDVVYAFLGAGGGYEEYALAKVEELAHKPASLNPVEAAAVPLAGITAWQGLFDHGGLQAGQRVLIHGGAGGVGHLAIQFAKARGAWVATTVSGDDAEFASRIGADKVIDYKSVAFEDAVDSLDMVFDLVGGETRTRSFAVLKQGGILVSTLGEPDRDEAERRGVRVAGYVAKPHGGQLAEIARLVDDGRVRVEVQQVFPLAEAAEAQRNLEVSHTRGKVVLELA